MVRVLLAVIAALSLLLPLGAAPKPAAAQPDWDIPMGHFFTQAAGPGETGFGVTDEAGVLMWSEFQRLGGVQAVGYPISERFQWHGFTCQAMQRVVFQWRPELGQVLFVNVFDLMTQAGKDDWLLAVRQTPKPVALSEAGMTWDQIVNMRLALLDANPAIKAAYFGVVGDPVTMNGLPTSGVTDMGNNFTLRAQRVVIQQWKVAVPWAAAGQVTFALGGSIAKEAGLLPLGAAPSPVATPAGPTPTTAPTATATPACPGPPVIASFVASPGTVGADGSSTLSWGAVTDATSVSINQGIGAVGAPGTKVVTPCSTTTYTLSAVGCGGTSTKQATVTVLPGGDISMVNLDLSDTNQVQFRVSRTGTIPASCGSLAYRIYRFRVTPFPAGSWVHVHEDKVPLPPVGSHTYTTDDVLIPAVFPNTNRIRVMINFGSLIPETNEANNVRDETCDLTTHSCSI